MNILAHWKSDIYRCADYESAEELKNNATKTWKVLAKMYDEYNIIDCDRSTLLLNSDSVVKALYIYSLDSNNYDVEIRELIGG